MFLYILRTEGAAIVKIGVSKDVKRRLLMLQGGCPLKLEICFARKLSRAVSAERQLHQVFMMDRMHGEWFRLDYRVAVREAKKVCAKLGDQHPNYWRVKDLQSQSPVKIFDLLAKKAHA